jgi:hypothetical protein
MPGGIGVVLLVSFFAPSAGAFGHMSRVIASLAVVVALPLLAGSLLAFSRRRSRHTASLVIALIYAVPLSLQWLGLFIWRLNYRSAFGPSDPLLSIFVGVTLWTAPIVLATFLLVRRLRAR